MRKRERGLRMMIFQKFINDQKLLINDKSSQPVGVKLFSSFRASIQEKGRTLTSSKMNGKGTDLNGMRKKLKINRMGNTILFEM